MSARGLRIMSMRRLLRQAALAGLAAMLFAQAALAFAACHEQEPANDALCAAHCQASEETLDKFQAKLPILSAALLPATYPRVVPQRTVFLPLERVPAASPPARILFRSLLI